MRSPTSFVDVLRWQRKEAQDSFGGKQHGVGYGYGIRQIRCRPDAMGPCGANTVVHGMDRIGE